jgi:hypothetical protein
VLTTSPWIWLLAKQRPKSPSEKRAFLLVVIVIAENVVMERILLSIHYKLMGEDGAIFSGLLK